MDELVLVRHAATAWSGRRFCGRTDLPLTTLGEAAASGLGMELAALLPPTVRIVSSPLLRARQTAAALVTATALGGYDIDDRWSETDFGVAEGLSYDELEQTLPDVASRLAGGDYHIDWPSGEPAAALRARVEVAWRELSEQPGSWVVVSHGGPLRIAIALAMNVEPSEVTVPAPGAVWRLRQDPVLPFPA